MYAWLKLLVRRRSNHFWISTARQMVRHDLVAGICRLAQAPTQEFTNQTFRWVSSTMSVESIDT